MVEKILLDTDALIELHKNRKELNRVLLSFDCHISIVSLYEYLFGLIYRGRDLEESKRYMEELYYVVPLTQEILKRALTLDVDLTKEGHRLEFRDLVMGATAIEMNMPLVTGNIKHFERMKAHGLSILPLSSLTGSSSHRSR